MFVHVILQVNRTQIELAQAGISRNDVSILQSIANENNYLLLHIVESSIPPLKLSRHATFALADVFSL